MKVIIAGGRDYVVGVPQQRWLDDLHGAFGIDEVVSGCAPGADSGGEAWARARGIAVKQFPADWHAHGRAAGPIRNAAMRDYLAACRDRDGANTLVVLFPGGRGTQSMKELALQANLAVFEYTTYEKGYT